MKPKIINLPKIEDTRGNLTFIEELSHIPFEIKRVFWIYDVPGGQVRGGHAYKEQKEFIVSLSGSLDIEVSNEDKTEVLHLNRSYYGLYIPNLYWRQMKNFSTNAVILVLSSTAYDEIDYIRDFNEYILYKS